MPNELYVVAYDGEHRRAVDHAIESAKRSGAKLHIVHVIEWSPYRFLTPQELEERHKRRSEEVARAEAEVIQPILSEMTAAGLTATGEIRYGNVVELLASIAQKQHATGIVMGRSGGTSFGGRVFGSAAMGLAQVSPVPVTIVP
ncbi:universal stress protein [Meridianimarinicoccus aquatilis]|uniref:Universal stress protein n=1 Tax=Meridianimarinicoccus aquatilis TaxID=2552766 RepID=A0A4R6AN55_9RHOB|nr:universal stress protein [Fluviibacterium aquatile]QIE40825.1 universal stress protein [Rhodobacteraceae bacterium SC52]TDL85781.1 universal stress protein [Fluviibacterium aquatile]